MSRNGVCFEMRFPGHLFCRTMNHRHHARETDRPPRLSPTRRNALWYTLQVIAQPLFAAWFRLRARGLDRIPAEGGALLLINHQSFLDPLLVGAPLSRPVSYLARDSLFRIPVIGWLLRRTYVIPINRESAGTGSIRAAVERLQQGFLVGVFPEGTRSHDGRLGPLKPGFVALIRRAQVPVVPVGIAGTGAAMPRHAWFVRPRTCRVVYGPPLAPEEIEAYFRLGREDELVALVRERMLRCCAEADAWRRGEEGGWREEDGSRKMED